MPDTPQPVADRSSSHSPELPSHTVKTELSTPGDQTAPTLPPPVTASPVLLVEPTVGTMVDQYRLDEKLGEGGMGAVWKAFHVKLKKHVALKLLPAHFTRDAKLVARFEREMEAVGKVDSPHVVRAMDAGEFQGLHYLVMEYIDGTDLSKFIDDRGPQPVRQSCELIRQAALGLAAAHKLGLVHRDIKPSNLFLTRPRDASSTATVKILDLGLARLAEDTAATDSGAGLTGTGMVMGTPDFMAPEQWNNTHTVDGRVDLYALGCTLFFLLTGRPPYGDDKHVGMLQKMAGHGTEPIPDLRTTRQSSRGQSKALDEVPDAVVSLYQRLMAKRPEDRVQTADELSQTLLAIVKALGSGGPGLATDTTPRTASAGSAAADRARTEASGRREPAESAGAPASKGRGADAPRSPADIHTTPTQPITAKGRPPAPSKPTGKKRPDDATHDEGLESVLKAMTPAPPRQSVRKTADAGRRSGRPSGSGVPTKVWIAAAGLAVVVLLAAIIIKITNKDGTTTEIKAPDALKVEITKTDDAKPAEPKTGWHGWPADAPKPAVAPFDAAQAMQHQKEWADYLKIPVEYTNSLGMKFRLIPPGEFLMGSKPEEIEAALAAAGNDEDWKQLIRSEAPQHRVVLTQAIYLSVHEVTQAQYERIMGKNPSYFMATAPGGVDVVNVATQDLPVERASWTDTAEFCTKLSEQEGLEPVYRRSGETVSMLPGTGYRMPTEAEWEFACRAGTTTRFWPGDRQEDLVLVGWLNVNSGSRTHAGGGLKANPLGLFDVHANVWEWVQDWWDPAYYAEFQDQVAIDPRGSTSGGAKRVARGGSWYIHHNAFRCRASARGAFNPMERINAHVGIRLAVGTAAVKAALKKSATQVETGSAWHGWPKDAPKPAIAPFTAEQAKKHQEEWAAYLKIPVEHTNSIGMKFVLIPPGEFTMGTATEEIEEMLKAVGDDKHSQECVKSEAPQHKVILTQPIYLGVTEVTQAEYEKVMGKNPSFFAKTGPEKQRTEKVEGLDTSAHPVEGVSWNDAAEFCAKLNQQEKLKPFYFRAGETVSPLDGTGYRLPTEAEWEFSCRAGTTTKFWIGESERELMNAGWFSGNANGRTHAVGELKANPFGLFDIHGNVYEWVQDAWEPTFYGEFQKKPAVDPSAPFSAGSWCVFRGGLCYTPAFLCRSSLRYAFATSSRFELIGFRVSLVAVGPRAGR